MGCARRRLVPRAPDIGPWRQPSREFLRVCDLRRSADGNDRFLGDALVPRPSRRSVFPDQFRRTGALGRPRDALIDFYRDEMAGHGIELDRDESRRRYAAYSFQTLMVAVTSMGLGALTERDATVRTVLQRSVAAIDRLGFREHLRAL